jgi:diaminohydroxyphosphoribosylaminopyrimidine deaminase/5-amino-6-(5-phosphoribosylamino)uracil reductase
MSRARRGAPPPAAAAARNGNEPESRVTVKGNETRFMRLAISCARRSEGHTRPNPPVGAVVVAPDGRILGTGRHRCAGGPHAEVEAIRACAEPPRGATLFVTLEPCSTAGRTPPCVDLILRSGISRVVAGCADPDPRHAGRGFELLRAAGVAVETGLCEAGCRALIEPFAKRTAASLPWLTLKLALTLDGRIADRRGRSKWITGAPARAWVQRLRRRADAIMVGAGTVIADDPGLQCRLRGAGAAWRVIVDGRGRLPPQARVLNDHWAAHTVVAVTPAGERALRRALPGDCPARLWSFPADRAGRIPMRELMARLAGELEALHVVCEGGGQLAGALAREGLVDEYALIYSPSLLGDAAARPALAGMDLPLSRRLVLRFTRARRLGDDLLVLARAAAGP